MVMICVQVTRRARSPAAALPAASSLSGPDVAFDAIRKHDGDMNLGRPLNLGDSFSNDGLVLLDNCLVDCSLVNLHPDSAVADIAVFGGLVGLPVRYFLEPLTMLSDISKFKRGTV